MHPTCCHGPRPLLCSSMPHPLCLAHTHNHDLAPYPASCAADLCGCYHHPSLPSRPLPTPPPPFRHAAMIIHTWRANQFTATSHWKHRWALYVLKAERRLPASWAQRLRLGQEAWDPKAQKSVYRWAAQMEKEPDAGPMLCCICGRLISVECTWMGVVRRQPRQPQGTQHCSLPRTSNAAWLVVCDIFPPCILAFLLLLTRYSLPTRQVACNMCGHTDRSCVGNACGTSRENAPLMWLMHC